MVYEAVFVPFVLFAICGDVYMKDLVGMGKCCTFVSRFDIGSLDTYYEAIEKYAED